MEIIRNTESGLLFINGVAFTKERLEYINDLITYGMENHQQFEYRIIVIDNGNMAEVIIDRKSIGIIFKTIDVNTIASDLSFAYDKK